MAEKGDVPADTVSLPPTYAPSEAYTESPPPAYRRDKSSRVAIVRMVCVTVVASALIIGFFILTSNYLNARSCNCGQDVLTSKTLQAASFVDLPRAGALVGLENNKLEDDKADDKLLADKQLENDVVKDMKTNDLDSEDEAIPPEANDQVVIDTIPVTEEEVRAAEEKVAEEEEAQRELEEVARMEAQMEEEEEALQDIMIAQMDHMKKIRLPVDLILGNPALAGRDVDCQVERRQQPLGGGIMTQAIIVTCSDDHDDQGPPRGPPAGPRRPGPPLSLLAPIMKMLSARAAASRVNQRLVPLNNPRPMPFPMGPVPCPGPFPCIMGRSKQVTPPMAGPLSRPMPGPLSRPMPGPLSRPMPSPLSGPMPMPGPMRGEARSLSSPFPGRPMPMIGPMRGEARSLSSPFPGPMPMVGPKNRPMLAPLNGPLPSQPKMDDGPRNRMLPFPFRPIARMTPRLMTTPQRKEAPVSLASLHRGALPLPPRPEVKKMIQHVVPKARGRALPDPVNLPGIRMLPGRLLAPAPPGAMERVSGGEDRRPITHMEMRAPPPPAPPKNMVHTGPRIVEFGPPRVHTVIRPALPNSPPKIQQAAPRLITHPRLPILPHDVHPVHNSPIPKDIMTPPKPIAVISKTIPIAGPQTTIAPPPPPPKFDPNGRSGIVPEINPDAEMVIKSQGPPQDSPQHLGPPQNSPQPLGPPQDSPQPLGLPQDSPHPLDPQEERKHHLLLVN